MKTCKRYWERPDARHLWTGGCDVAVNVDRANIHTAWHLRSKVRESQPDLKMVFAAYSAGRLRWFQPGSQADDAFDADEEWPCGRYETIHIGKSRNKGQISYGQAVDILADAAGTAPICIVAYQAKRNVTWRTTRGYQNPRCQTHLCNGLPKSWDMPNYAQANGRATGDSKELLESSTRLPGAPVGSGRRHITFLGHRWDHESDLATEAWVDEVGHRMLHRNMDLQEATDGQLHPFPPSCNFRLGRLSRKPNPNRLTFDRRYMYEHKHTYHPDGLGYDLVISPEDPREEEAAAYHVRARNASSYLSGTSSLFDAYPDEAVVTDQETILQSAEEVAAEVLEDAGSTLSMYALPPAATKASLTPHLPAVMEGEAQPPLIITEFQMLSMADLGLDLTVDQAQHQICQPSNGTLGAAVKHHFGNCTGVQYSFMHNIAKLNKDIRTLLSPLTDTPYNVTWRAYEDEGEARVAAVRLCAPLPGPSSTSNWTRDDLQQPQYQNRRIVWHTFTGVPTKEIMGDDGTMSLVMPTVTVVSRGPLAGLPSMADRPKRKRSNVTLGQMVQAKILQPGADCITTKYKGVQYVASLSDKGHIVYNDRSFSSPTAFKKSITCGNNTAWDDVKYKGTKLCVFRARLE